MSAKTTEKLSVVLFSRTAPGGPRLAAWWCLLFALAASSVGASAAPAQDFQSLLPLVSYAPELTNYESAAASDAVAQLQKRLDNGQAELKFEERHGYLLSLLRELGLPLQSQLLVFSKTSLQRYHISSKSPRAIFFNDRTYVAWIPTAPMLEVLAVDPKLGAVFYTLAQTNVPRPKLTRENRCLECHVTPRTLDVPGALVRSFNTAKDGEVDLLSGAAIVSHRTPLSERWGGWYVTGAYGSLLHRGNHFRVATPEPPSSADAGSGAADLARFFDVSQYPHATSDIVGLLVLEHQIQMQNLLTRLNYETAASLREYGHIRHLTNLCETVLKYLLFVDEASLGGTVKGTSEFTEWFERQGPRDKQDRSLRQFDLQARLFRFPCSYLIYSPLFEALPRETKLHLYRRLYDILSGEDTSPPFQKISSETRHSIFDILLQTKGGLPAYWDL